MREHMGVFNEQHNRFTEFMEWAGSLVTKQVTSIQLAFEDSLNVDFGDYDE